MNENSGKKSEDAKQRIKIMSFNIKRPLLNRLTIPVKLRASGAAELISRSDADIICLQELMPQVKKYILSRLCQYEAVGLGRNKNGTGEHVDILCRRKRAEIISYSTFFINHRTLNPLKKQLFIFPRICTVADVKLKETGREVRVYNVHLDHISRSARRTELKILSEHISRDMRLKPLPTLICGDFNSKPGCVNFNCLYEMEPRFSALDRFRIDITKQKSALPQKALSILNRDGYVATTLCGLSLDHIFYTPDIHPVRMRVLRKEIAEKSLSDHYALLAEFTM